MVTLCSSDMLAALVFSQFVGHYRGYLTTETATKAGIQALIHWKFALRWNTRHLQ